MQVCSALERGQKCTKVVKIPSSVKTVGAYISCPLPFGKNKSLEGLVADSSTKKLTCDYDTGVVCQYDLKTGKKVAKSGKSATLQKRVCGSSSQAAPPRQPSPPAAASCATLAARQRTSPATKTLQSISTGTHSTSLRRCSAVRCTPALAHKSDFRIVYGERRCYYEYTGNLWTLEENDPDCPERSAAKPGFCLLRR
jgi:hypothetical protein